jgi:hypothetical protein
VISLERAFGDALSVALTGLAALLHNLHCRAFGFLSKGYLSQRGEKGLWKNTPSGSRGYRQVYREIVPQRRDRKLRLEVSCRIPSAGVTAFVGAGFEYAVGFEGNAEFSMCLDVSFALAVLFSTVRTHWGSSGICFALLRRYRMG